MSKKVVYIGAPEGFTAMREVLAGMDCVHAEASPEALRKELVGASALLDASMKVRVDARMLQASPELAIISCATTGSDHIDRTATAASGVDVRTLREDRELLLNITPAAEHSWALLLACARHIPAAHAHVVAGGWTRELFPGVMIKGKQLGLIGCGRIGTWMSRYATAFGATCVGYDPHLTDFPETIRPVGLEELVIGSDFISLHVHLSPETKRLLSAELLARVKPGVIVVNTSRGGVLDEEALVKGLDEKRIAAVGVDVIEVEPDISRSPLWNYAQTHDNVVITPHCGGFSPDAVAIVCRRAAEKISARLAS